MVRRARAVLYGAGILLSVVVALAGRSAAAAEPSAFVSVRTDFDATTRMASIYLTNSGSRTIIGGSVRVAFTCSDGSSTEPLDLRFDLLPSVGMEGTLGDKRAIRDPLIPIGGLQPEQTYRILQSPPAIPRGVVAESANAQVIALVFMDNTAVGDSKSIDGQFESWRDIGATWAAWNKRASEVLTSNGDMAALLQLSGETKAILARHPRTEARIRLRAPATEEEALARHCPTLEEADHFVDQVRAEVDSKRTSEAEGLSMVKAYFRLRAETAAAHANRKGGE
jgi:hypothetical protein